MNVFGAASGAAYVVLVVVGNGLYTDWGSASLGYGLEMLGYAALACFIAYVASALRTRGSWASALAVVGGASALAVHFSGWAAVLASEHASVAAETAAALIQIDESAFVVSWLPHGLFVIGLAAAAMILGRLPRWLAWTGMVFGAAEIVTVAIAADEPFAVPYLLALLWIVVASVLLARGARRRDTAWSVEV
jgi:hypothetical protein